MSALPQRFRFLARKISQWPKEITARIYLTCKSKCWGEFHLKCTKPDHSHCRKIVSYSGLCLKSLIRTPHRGGQFVVQASGTFAQWSLGNARQALMIQMRNPAIRPARPHTCYKCGAPKDDEQPGSTLNFFVTDPGKFYEQNQTPTAEEDFQWHCDRVEDRTSHDTVTVVRSGTVHGHLGGRVPLKVDHGSRVQAFSLQELCEWCSLVLSLC